MPDIEKTEKSPVIESSEMEDKTSKGNTPEGEQLDNVEAKDQWVDVLGSGDLKMKTLTEGDPGSRPQISDICYVKILGELEDGTVFESHDELVVELNGSEVIQGLDLVLALLDVGQKATAIVKPRFGYGALGLEKKVPPHATLIYTVEMLRVEYRPELTCIPFEERKFKASFKKDKGNWWYSRKDGHKAVQCYRSAIDLLQETTPFTDDNGTVTELPEEIFKSFVELKLVVYNNLAAAQILIDAYDAALLSVENVLKIESKNIKALFRKGKILEAKGNTDEAVETFKYIAILEPDNNAVRRELNACLQQQSKENLQAKSLYKKMLGTEKKDDETNDLISTKSESGKSSSTSSLTKILGAAALASVGAALAFGFSFNKKSLMFWE